MPNLLAMMESTGQLQRAIIGRDSQQGTTQDFANVISPPIPCSVQRASAQVTMLYKQRNSEVIYTVYMPTDPGAQVNDNFIVTDRLGNQKTLLVRDEAQQVDRDVIWVMTCAWFKSPQTATAQATKFLVSAPDEVTVGVPFDFTVQAVNSVNQPVTTYVGPVAFYAFTDSLAVLPAPSDLVGGFGSFAATLNTLGSQQLYVQDSVNWTIGGFSGDIEVELLSKEWDTCAVDWDQANFNWNS